MATGVWQRLGGAVRATTVQLTKAARTPARTARQRTSGRSAPTPSPRARTSPRPAAPAVDTLAAGGTLASTARAAYPGDFVGAPRWEYAPEPDGLADPGEVVWAWVPYEEDHSQGKDRPALVVGRDGPWLLAMPLTSKDHDRDAAQEARAGRHWVDVGSGRWDSSGRPSEARVDRVVRLDPLSVRREGAALSRARFDSVVEARIQVHGTQRDS